MILGKERGGIFRRFLPKQREGLAPGHTEGTGRQRFLAWPVSCLHLSAS